MTQTCTQKRYRQYHHDNTAPRFRDLPPRFKRQKSSTSKAESIEILKNQENRNILKVQSTPSSGFDTGATMKQPMSQMCRQNVPFNDPVLSVDTKLYNNSPFQVVDQYGRGYLCYQECSTPPISPYGILHNRQVEIPSSAQSLSPFSENARAISRPCNTEAMSPCLDMAVVAVQGVKKNEIVHQSRQMCSSVGETKAVKSSDYSDPDLRTMEMLRELERVADQKEKEDQERERKEREESGNLKDNDRKNYVSHHLRMLMCAVDRYTADIDELPCKSESDFITPTNVETQPSKELRKPLPVPNSKLREEVHCSFNHQDVDFLKIKNGKRNHIWSQSNNHCNQFANYPGQQWSNMQQTGLPFGSGPKIGPHTPPSHVVMPLTSTQGSLLQGTSPLMHHMLTPPPSRTSSPHPSPCLQKSAPVTPQSSFFPKQPAPQSQLVAKALEFSNNEPKPQESLGHLISPVTQANCSGLGHGGWDIWSGPSIFDINSNVNTQKERKPLYNR